MSGHIGTHRDTSGHIGTHRNTFFIFLFVTIASGFEGPRAYLGFLEKKKSGIFSKSGIFQKTHFQDMISRRFGTFGVDWTPFQRILFYTQKVLVPRGTFERLKTFCFIVMSQS